ncbi:hypothetical protein JHFBIEKO_0263 [Methylobacterium mesophilicum]|uniref:hypothetical protein n=2 Tax=Methylobacterium mesophilicum TaxID=39956 RepID=UPI001EE18AB2|nr:hypothetical protein [Methylobacterium mesophilicum]GJE19843.1 hypothetical protein JHFBIEKO_0263 [Methylobacterium mesophilicum]
MPFVSRRPRPAPSSRQPHEDAPWAVLAETCSTDHEALLNRERAIVQLRRARLQAGLANAKGSPDDRRH